MENSTNSDETYDRGYRPSLSSIDQNDQTSTSETPVYSTMSADSFAYQRTNSETSAFSDPIDDNSSCSEPSPSNWPVSGSEQPALGRSEMRQQKTVVDKNLDDQESMDLGRVLFYIYIYNFSLSLSLRVLKPEQNLDNCCCDNFIGRAGAYEGKICKAFAWWRYVRKWQRSVHSCYNLKCHNQSLW